MITVRIKGGLGNQLFQYASAYALAKKHDTGLQIDATFFSTQTMRAYKLGMFNVEYDDIVVEKQLGKGVAVIKNKYINKGLRMADIHCIPCGNRRMYLLETRSDLVPEYFSIKNNEVYMDGYYQSEKYFGKYRKELLEQFTPKYEYEREYFEVLELIKNSTSVAVHVRRGDFLEAQNDRNPRHYLLEEKYYRNSLAYMESQVSEPIFFWFSDDIEWVKNTFGKRGNFRYINLKTKYADIDELMLMKTCRHIIAANSTFSWWAAWLNENENVVRIVPSRPYGNIEMIPDGWMRL